MRHILLIALGVCRASIECTEVATLTSQDLLSRFLICVKSGCEVFLLLLNVVERLINVILFSLCRKYDGVQALDLSEGSSSSIRFEMYLKGHAHYSHSQ